jgi:hypothetical protein
VAPITDQVVRPVQCPLCSAWLIVGTCNGFKVVCEAAPIALGEYAAQRIAGREVYRLHERTRKLRLVLPSAPLGDAKLMRLHDCPGARSVPLTPRAAAVRPSPCMWQGGAPTPSGTCARSPQEAAQGVRSCKECDPPPFDHAVTERAAHAMFVSMLGATVVEVINHEQ